MELISSPAAATPCRLAPEAAAAGPGGLSVDSGLLHSILVPTHRELRARVFELFKEPIFRPRHGLDLPSERKLFVDRWRRLHEAGLFRGLITTGDVVRYDVLIDCVSLLDHSLETGLGVHYGLFASTIAKLGSEAQVREWIPKIERLEARGCFALTELGHGSNVRGIETVAEYDREREVFVLNTPSETAQKYWIGNARDMADFAVVFAKLFIDGKNRGIHAFITRLRNEDWSVAKGVQLADCGHKEGLNGVGNGRIWFTDVLVPRRNLLSGSSQVAPDGHYTSSFESPDTQFAAQLAGLTGGRVGIVYRMVGMVQLGLAIAVPYALSRKAFSPGPNLPEVPLMTYKSHQHRLLIPLCTSYVYCLCAQDLREKWHATAEARAAVSKEVHVLSSGLKAVFTWWMMDALQDCREACGGMGYKSENRIARLRSDHDIACTFEGDNVVLMGQVAKYVLAQYASRWRWARNPQSLPDVHSESFERAAFSNYELSLARELSAGLKSKTRGGQSAFDAWNDLQLLANETGAGHLRCAIYDIYQKRMARLPRSTRPLLALCGRVWALNAIDKDPSFARAGVLTKSELAQVHELLYQLLAKIVPHAKALVDAFGIPEHLLAPIAGDWVAHNSRAKL